MKATTTLEELGIPVEAGLHRVEGGFLTGDCVELSHPLSKALSLCGRNATIRLTLITNGSWKVTGVEPRDFS